MARRIERRNARRSACRVVGWLFAGLASGCVNAGELPGDGVVECALARSLSATDAIVLVYADLATGPILCSGTAIAPTLVVTALGCVVRPTEVGDPGELGDESARTGPVSLQSASVDYERVCSRGDSWLPLERGDFGAQLGQPIDATVISVSSDAGQSVVVKRVVTSGATSRCADGLALLVLERELEVAPIPVRFDDATFVDDPVTLTGYCNPNGPSERRDLDARIDAVTFGSGMERTPPRSLSLDRGVTAQEVGGAVVAADTGALVGTITSGVGALCSEPDPSGRTLALRVAPFRRMLVETAAASGETLIGEWSPGTPDAAFCLSGSRGDESEL